MVDCSYPKELFTMSSAKALDAIREPCPDPEGFRDGIGAGGVPQGLITEIT